MKKTLFHLLLCVTVLFSGETQVWGQPTVVTPESIANEAGGSLAGSTVNLELSGSWSSNDLLNLTKALHPYGDYLARENSILETVTFANGAEFTGESLSLSHLFYYCSALTSVKLPDYSLAAVDLSHAFRSCKALKRINSEVDGVFDLTSFAKGANNLNYTFSGCTEATSIKLSGNTEGAVNFSYAFYGCTLLESINSNDPGVFDLSSLSDGISSLEATFSVCPKPVSIILPDYYAGEVSFDNAFYNCSLLKRVNIGADEPTKDGVFNLIPSSPDGVLISVRAAFFGCAEAVSIQIPVNSDKEISLAGSFANCTSLKRINSEEDGLFDLSGFTKGLYGASLRQSFLNCHEAVSIKLPDTSSEYNSKFNMSLAFSECTSLKRINSETDGVFDLTFLKTGIASGVSSGLVSAFVNCSEAVSIILPDYVDGAISFTSAFQGCKSLQSIKGLGTYTSISRVTNFFKDCYSLLYAELGMVPSSNLTDAFSGTNQNCLKYLPAGTIIPDDWESYSNFIIGNQSEGNITLADRVEGTIPGEEGFNPFYCPTAFTVAPGYSITYTRPADNMQYATSTNGWNTLALPFDATLQIDGTAKTPVTTGGQGDYWLRSFASSTADGEVTFTDTGNGVILANVPYLFALPGSSFGEDTMEGKDAVFTSAVSAEDALVTVKASNDVDYSSQENFSYRSVFTPRVASAMYLLTPGEGEKGDGFVLYSEGNVSSFRAYFTEVVTNGQTSGVRQLRIGNGNSATNLSLLSTDPSVTDSEAPRKVITKDGFRIIKGNLVYTMDGSLAGTLENE